MTLDKDILRSDLSLHRKGMQGPQIDQYYMN